MFTIECPPPASAEPTNLDDETRVIAHEADPWGWNDVTVLHGTEADPFPASVYGCPHVDRWTVVVHPHALAMCDLLGARKTTYGTPTHGGLSAQRLLTLTWERAVRDGIADELWRAYDCGCPAETVAAHDAAKAALAAEMEHDDDDCGW